MPAILRVRETDRRASEFASLLLNLLVIQQLEEVPSLVDLLAIVSKLVDYIVATHSKFGALVDQTLDGKWHSILDTTVDREGGEFTLATFVDSGMDSGLII
jgi:hypothetical protein